MLPGPNHSFSGPLSALAAGWIQATEKQECGQPCPPELDLKSATRGHGCPCSGVWAFLVPEGPLETIQGFNLGFPAPETVQVPKGRLKFIPTNIEDRVPRGVSSAKPGT